MAIGDPGIGALDAGGEVLQRRHRAGPEAEGAIDMHPGIVRVADRDDLGERIEGAGIDLPGLRDHHLRAAQRPDGRLERGGQHAALIVGVDADDPLAAEADQLQRREQRGVRVGADQHMHRRRAEQPVGVGVPTGLQQRAGARGGEAGAVGDGGAGGKADAGFSGQVEDVEQPALGHFLERRGGRRGGVVAGVLAPGADQHVGSDAGRMRGAHHPGEEARPDGRHQPGRGKLGQFVDHGGGVGAGLGRRR